MDRFLITFPKCLRPTPTQTSQALEALKENGLTNCDDIFIEIARLHTSRSTYTLTQEAAVTLNGLNEEFITEVNEAIMEGRTPPKTKKMDVILRVAAALHIFNHVASHLLAHRQTTPPVDAIEKSTLLKAIDCVTWAESQKEIFVEVTIIYRFYPIAYDIVPKTKVGFSGLSKEKKLDATIEKGTSFVCSGKATTY